MRSFYFLLLIFVCVLLLQCGLVHGQAPPLTRELKSALVQVPLENFPDTVRFVNVPAGYKARVFYRGNLAKPRFMSWDHKGTLHVINMRSGLVLALPDRNGDHSADTAIVAARDVYGHDVKFFRGDMYVAEELRVKKLSDNDGDGYYESSSIFIDSILPGKQRPPGGHTTRTIVIDSLKGRIYLSVGSLCNVCREEERAVIYSYNLEGKNKKIFAKGTRNCIGMDLHPSTGRLWANNNGSDHMGDDIPPEWVDEILENGFYGYPFAYGSGTFFDFNKHEDYRLLLPLTREDSALVRSMKKPAALLQAHSAPMALIFTSGKMAPPYRDGILTAFRGSWDRKVPTGYKVIFLKLKGNKVEYVTDFLTGFLPAGQKPWARPVGLAIDDSGGVYMGSDDINEMIIKVYRD